jgi:hypothetical protein
VVSSDMIKSRKQLNISNNSVSISKRENIPVFSFEHWKGNKSGALIKLVKKTNDPLVAFKSFIGSKSVNNDMINITSSNANYVDPMFTMRDLQGWNETYGLPYAYSKFLGACDIDKYYAQIPMNADIMKIKIAPIKF